MTTTAKLFSIVTIILLGLIVFLGIRLDSYKNVIETQNHNITALTDTLHKTKNKLNEEVSNIAGFEGVVTNQFLQIKSQDSTISQLQEVVKANKDRIKEAGSVTNFRSDTYVSKKFKTDSVKFDSAIPVGTAYPTYTTDFNLQDWVKGTIKSGKDSTNINLSIKNDYSVVVGYDKGKPFSEVTNHNPYSSTQTQRSYITKVPPTKTWAFGVGAGFGVGIHNNQVFTTPIVGPVITKTFFRW